MNRKDSQGDINIQIMMMENKSKPNTEAWETEEGERVTRFYNQRPKESIPLAVSTVFCTQQVFNACAELNS